MKYEISVKTKDGYHVVDDAVRWIKAVREETGCGLREAKDLRDYLTQELTRMGVQYSVITFMVDPAKLTFLGFLGYVRSSGHMVKPAASTAAIGVVNPRNHADELLKQTAIKLIKLGEYSKSIDVLKILI